jgi:quercetin dioxygenase-like cupin family protein
MVRCTPGARTLRHSHGAGQIMIVPPGRGLAHPRAAAGRALTAGDIVYVPHGEERRHGAADDAMLVHVAVSPGETRRLDEVAEALYRRVREAGGAG